MNIKILTIVLCFTIAPLANSAKANKPDDTKATTGYSLTKHTISSGGGVITNGTFTVTSSIGQLDAGHVSTNGSYQFSGGIISERVSTIKPEIMFINGFE